MAIPSYAAVTNKTIKSTTKIADLSALKIPSEIGRVQDVYKGESAQTVFLIQDAHAIPDAQRNIQKLIDYCQKNFGVNLVAVEGAASELDPQLFRSFPDKDLLKKIFEEYLQRGEVTGATLAAIFSAPLKAGTDPSSGGNDAPAQYFGVEDWSLYEEGLRFYLKAQENEQAVRKELEARRQKLEDRKNAIYSKELLALDKALGNFHRNRVGLIEVLKSLAAVKAPERGTELALLVSAIKTDGSVPVKRGGEEISHEQEQQATVAVEIKDVAAKIKKTLTSSSDLVSFNDQFQKYQTSQMTPEAFALFLQELARRHHLTVKFSDHLKHLMKNERRMKDIEGTKLFKDFENYAGVVKGSLFANAEQKKLDGESANLDLAERLANFELTRDDWNEIRTSIEHSAESMGSDSMPYALGPMLQPHISFYRNAEAREAAMFSNYMKRMRSLPQAPSSMLIAGGFHTEGMIHRLKEQGISYVLLMPQIGSIPQDTHYRDLMKGSVSWKNYFQVENGSEAVPGGGKVDLYKAFVRATRDKLLHRAESIEHGVKDNLEPHALSPMPSAQLLKQWRDQIIRDSAKAGKIMQVNQYTSFMDEIPAAQNQGRPEWMNKVDRFIDGLRKLDSQGKLTENNIVKLFQPSTMLQMVGGNTNIAVDANVDASNVAAIHSELRGHAGLVAAFFKPFQYTLNGKLTENLTQELRQYQQPDFIHHISERKFSGPGTEDQSMPVAEQGATTEGIDDRQEVMVIATEDDGVVERIYISNQNGKLQIRQEKESIPFQTKTAITTTIGNKRAAVKWQGEEKIDTETKNFENPNLGLIEKIEVFPSSNYPSFRVYANLSEDVLEGISGHLDQLQSEHDFRVNVQFHPTPPRSELRSKVVDLELGVQTPVTSEITMVFSSSKKGMEGSFSVNAPGQHIHTEQHFEKIAAGELYKNPEADRLPKFGLEHIIQGSIPEDLAILFSSGNFQSLGGSYSLKQGDRLIVGNSPKKEENTIIEIVKVTNRKVQVSINEIASRSELRVDVDAEGQQQIQALVKTAIEAISLARKQSDAPGSVVDSFEQSLRNIQEAVSRADFSMVMQLIASEADAVNLSGLWTDSWYKKSLNSPMSAIFAWEPQYLPRSRSERRAAEGAVKEKNGHETLKTKVVEEAKRLLAGEKTLKSIELRPDESGFDDVIDLHLTFQLGTYDSSRPLADKLLADLRNSFPGVLSEESFVQDGGIHYWIRLILARSEARTAQDLMTLLGQGKSIEAIEAETDLKSDSVSRFNESVMAAYIEATLLNENGQILDRRTVAAELNVKYRNYLAYHFYFPNQKIKDVLVIRTARQEIEKLNTQQAELTRSELREKTVINDETPIQVGDWVKTTDFGIEKYSQILGSRTGGFGGDQYFFKSGSDPEITRTKKELHGAILISKNEMFANGFFWNLQGLGRVHRQEIQKALQTLSTNPEQPAAVIGQAGAMLNDLHSGGPVTKEMESFLNTYARRSEVREKFSLKIGPAQAPNYIGDLADNTRLHILDLKDSRNADIFRQLIKLAKFNEADLPSLTEKRFGANLIFPLDWNGNNGESNPVLVFGIQRQDGKTFGIEFVIDAAKRPVFRPEPISNLKKLTVTSMHYAGHNVLIETQSRPEVRNGSPVRTLQEAINLVIGLPKWGRADRYKLSVTLHEAETYNLKDLKGRVFIRMATGAVDQTSESSMSYAGRAASHQTVTHVRTLDIKVDSSKLTKRNIPALLGEIEEGFRTGITGEQYDLSKWPGWSPLRKGIEKNYPNTRRITTLAQNIRKKLEKAEQEALRSELRQTAVGIVAAFKGGVRNFNQGRAAQTIERAEIREFIPVLLAAAVDARTRYDVEIGTAAKNHFEAIRAIDRPVVIRYDLSNSDRAQMGNRAGSEIRTLMQTMHDTSAANKNVIGVLSVPDEMRSELRLADHNQRDAVRLEITGNTATVTNTGLQNSAAILSRTPAITVTASSATNGTILFSDRDAEGRGFPNDGHTASQLFTAGVLAAGSLSKQTADLLVRSESRSDAFFIANRNALDALSSLIELMAQYCSELRIKRSA